MARDDIRLDAMLSSTSTDLPEHRKQAQDALLRAGFFPQVMEHIPARLDADAIKVSLELVDQAEVYIGIFGHRYGFMPNDADQNPDKISITEMEYWRAKELGMPILIFIMDDNYPTPPDVSGLNAKDMMEAVDDFRKTHFETDSDGKIKLEKFKTELTSNHIVDFFTTPDDLRALILQAVLNDELKEKALAYYESQQSRVDPEKSSEDAKLPASKTGIPPLPELYALPSYSDQSAVFIGRANEFQLLDTWSKPASKTPMLVIEAIGGMGKSALTWNWVQDRVRMKDFEGVFWYSFYEGGADMSATIRYALAYVTQRNPDDLKGQQVTHMLAELLKILKERRFLIVLDGLERILVAYHRWDAAQMQDSEIKGTKHHRATTNPRDGDFLKRMANCNNSRILITSRLTPNALQQPRGMLKGVQHAQLQGLSNTDARHLWEQWGITWDDEGRLDTFYNDLGGHGLLLKLVAGEIANNIRARGNFDVWYDFNSETFNAFESVVAKRNHILNVAYQDLSPESQKLLSQIAVLGDAVDLDTLSVFNPYLDEKPQPIREPDIERYQRRIEQYEQLIKEGNEYYKSSLEQFKQEFAEQQQTYEEYPQKLADYQAQYKQTIPKFDQLLAELEDRGLLWWDRNTGLYDLHPVVRGYASNRLNQDERPQTYDRIYNFFERQEKSNKLDMEMTLEDLKPYITMYTALIGAENYDRASSLYRSYIQYPLGTYLGAYQKAYELILPLFVDGLHKLPKGNSIGFQLNNMERVLLRIGRLDEQVIVLQTTLEYDISNKDTENVAFTMAMWLENAVYRSLLGEATHVQTILNRLSEIMNDKQIKSLENLSAIELYSTIGQWQILDTAFPAYMEIPWNVNVEYVIAEAMTGYARGLWWRGGDYHEMLTRAEKQCHIGKNPYQLRALLWMKSEIALEENRLSDAVANLSESIRMCNEGGVVREERFHIRAWGCLARTYLAQGKPDEATKIITDGADAYSSAVVLREIDPERAHEFAVEAYKKAWADGEPYVHRWDLNRAIALLEDMGIDKPILPDFDEATYKPSKHEDMAWEYIRKLEKEKSEQDDDNDD